MLRPSSVRDLVRPHQSPTCVEFHALRVSHVRPIAVDVVDWIASVYSILSRGTHPINTTTSFSFVRIVAGDVVDQLAGDCSRLSE